MEKKVLGRKPTLGQVLDYYTRDDFLLFLLHTLQRALHHLQGGV
jgi:hypothetical protein